MSSSRIKEATGIPFADVVFDTIEKNKQALVFVNTKRGAEKAAEDLGKKYEQLKKKNKIRSEMSSGLNSLSDKILKAIPSPTRQCRRLSLCIKNGFAFHHSGLSQKQKDLIEDAFRSNVLKIICCTPTLAAGVDLPAYRTIIRDLKRFGRKGMRFIPVLEFMQMAGRAGRPTYDDEGQSVIFASSDAEKENLTEKYLLGEPEPIYSKLAVESVLRTYLLSLISSMMVNTREQIMRFFSKTFWAHQFDDFQHLESKIDSMLQFLTEWEMISSSEKPVDFISADDYRADSYKATLIGRRVAELYLDPLTAFQIMQRIRKADSVILKDMSFLQMISHTLEMEPLLRVKNKDMELIEDAIVEFEGSFLDNEPSMYDMEYSDYLNSVKTALFFKDWIDEHDEEYLLEHYDIRPGEIRMKLSLADWLLYASQEISRIMRKHHLIKEIQKTRLRIRYGVKEELLPLLKLKTIGRIRARKLFDNGFKSISDVKREDISRLIKIVGRSSALRIKEQAGASVQVPVGMNKRKGQINLRDFGE